MGFFDNIKAGLAQLSSNLQKEVSKYKNGDFADASMAMCALIAAADGTIGPDEKRKMAGFILSNDLLQAFKPEDLKTKFGHFAGKLEADYEFGKVACIQAINKLKKDLDQARVVVQVGIIIGGSDGTSMRTRRRPFEKCARRSGSIRATSTFDPGCRAGRVPGTGPVVVSIGRTIQCRDVRSVIGATVKAVCAAIPNDQGTMVLRRQKPSVESKKIRGRDSVASMIPFRGRLFDRWAETTL